MTFVELYSRVLADAKLQSGDPTSLALAKDYVNKAIVQLSREKKYREGIVFNQNVAVTSATAAATFPADLIVEDQVRYRVTVAGTIIKEWILSERSGLVSPAPYRGKPSTYYMGVAHTIIFDPYLGILSTTDSVQLDYFKNTPLTADADATKAPMWDEEIVARAVSGIQVRENKLEQAKFKLSVDSTGNTPSPSEK